MDQSKDGKLLFGKCPACHRDFHFNFYYKEVLALLAESMKEGKPKHREERKKNLQIDYYVHDSRIDVMLKEILLIDGMDVVNHHIFFYIDNNLQIRGMVCKTDEELVRMLEGVRKKKINEDQIPSLIGAIVWVLSSHSV